MQESAPLTLTPPGQGMEGGRDPEQKPPEVVFVSSSVAAAGASVSVAISMNCSIDWTSWSASQPDQREVQAGGT